MIDTDLLRADADYRALMKAYNKSGSEAALLDVARRLVGKSDIVAVRLLNSCVERNARNWTALGTLAIFAETMEQNFDKAEDVLKNL